MLTSIAIAPPASAVTYVSSANGYVWDFYDITDTDSGGIEDGGNTADDTSRYDDAFDDYGMIDVIVKDAGGNELVDTGEMTGFGLTYDATTRTFTSTTPVTVSAGADDLLEVTRTIWVPEGTDYVRYVDDFKNLTDQTLTVTVVWGGDLGSDSDTEVAATSSGDKVLTAGDTTAVTREGDADTSTDEAATDPVVAYALGSAGNGALQDPVEFYDPTIDWPSEGDEYLGHRYEFDLDAGQTASLAYFLYRGLSEENENSTDERYGANTPAEGTEVLKAAMTVSALRDNPNFTGLTTEQRARIANWEVPNFTATPASGDAPETITVSGTVCGTSSEGNYNALVSVVPAGGGDAVTTGTFTSSATGAWSGTIEIPSGTAVGDYTINAICRLDTTERAAYTSQTFKVTVPPNLQTGGNGYRMVAADGGIFTFGNRNFWGSTGAMTLNKPIVGGATDVSDYDGYWIVAADGGVFSFNAPFHGSLGDKVLTSPAVEIEPTPTGTGYWIVQADGTVTAFGTAKHHGDMRGTTLNQPIIGMSVAPDGLGYWLVAKDGGIFTFGSAEFFGSMGAQKLNAPVIDLAPMPDGKGYYLIGGDGGVFTFGTAKFWGSTGAMTLNAPVVAALTTPSGTGYWLAASDGGIFTFGSNIDFLGSMGGTKLNAPVLDLIN